VIASESEPILDAIAKILHDSPETTLTLAGHADTRGTAKQNEWLSRNRASAVRKYLIAKGIAAKRISSHGEGALAVPTEPGISQIEAYARARRVDFIFEKLPDIETEKQLLDLQPDH
jgi:outer membrane protein OmpA-like peptidoglycan-associated protein